MKCDAVVPAGSRVSDDLWREAWLWLQPAVERGGEGVTEDELLSDIRSGMAQLWLVYRDGAMVAAAVTQVGGDSLHFWLCGGFGCNWRDCVAQVMQFATERGIRKYTIDGRRGWQRVLR